MAKKTTPYGYWSSKNNVLADAKNYNSQTDWAKNSSGAHGSAKRNKWLSEACAHMTGGHKPANYWTSEKLIASASEFTTIASWRKSNASAYTTAKVKGILPECCKHMRKDRMASGYWTKEIVIDSAKKFQTIISWSIGDSKAYDASKRYGWYKEATRHMSKTYSHGEHTINTFLLEHDIKYVHQKKFKNLKHKKLLPYDFYLPEYNLLIEYQGRQHYEVSKSSIFQKDIADLKYRDSLKRNYAINSGFNYLEINAQKVSDIEKIILQELKTISESNGLKLNLKRRNLTNEEKSKIESLGIWTKDAVLADAKKYQFLKDWSSSGSAASQIAYKNGWINEATKHMTKTQKPTGYWTKERILNDAKKYKTRKEWSRSSKSAYVTAHAKKWADDACAHMKKAAQKKQNI